MHHVYNPETETISQIERLEHEARSIRRRIEHVHNDEDRRVMNRQLAEIKADIDCLRARLP